MKWQGSITTDNSSAVDWCYLEFSPTKTFLLKIFDLLREVGYLVSDTRE